MDAKIIPFKRYPPTVPSERDVPVWVRLFCRMFDKDIGLGVRAPERFFVCYDEDGVVYYLNLGYAPVQLEKAVAAAADHIDDNDKI